MSRFTYDARNQLRQVAIGGTEVGRFVYDHRGLRVEKQGERGIERNTYDGDSLLLQSDTSGNLLAHYRYGAFRLLSLTESGKDSEYYVFDSLGSPVNLTTLGGDVTARYQYDAWGHKRLDASTSWNRISFTGHEEDTETGLIYAKARFYDPDTGRFLTQDPWEGDISIAPSLHKYLYAYGNPTVYWDRDGLKSIFGDATQQLANFKEWLGEKNIEADSQWAAAAIGTAQFVTTLGEGITRPLDVVANLAQVATGVDDQQVRDELAGTKQAIKGAADFVVHGDYGQAVANIHEKAVSETVSALEGKVDATANLTQGILAIATLREVGPRGKGGVVKESASSTSAKVQAETAGLERIKANVAQNKSLNERINARGAAKADVTNRVAIDAKADVLALKNATQSPAGKNTHFLINERAAAADLRAMESRIKDAHFVSRHGPETTLAQQRLRATSGLTPDKMQGKKMDASRWASYQDMSEAIQKAQVIYNKTGQTSVPVDLGRSIGEGYLKGGTAYVQTTRAIVRFDANGQPYTAYPKLR